MRKKLEHENFRSLKKTIAKYSIALCNYVLRTIWKDSLNLSYSSKTKKPFSYQRLATLHHICRFQITFFENTKSSLMQKNVFYDSMTQWVELFSTV